MRAPVTWAVNGQIYRLTSLITHIIGPTNLSSLCVRGSDWWSSPAGVDTLRLDLGPGKGVLVGASVEVPG